MSKLAIIMMLVLGACDRAEAIKSYDQISPWVLTRYDERGAMIPSNHIGFETQKACEYLRDQINRDDDRDWATCHKREQNK